MRHAVGFAASIACVLVVIGVHAQTTGRVVRLNVAGQERTALVFAPTMVTPGGKAPLVLAFHGHGGTMRSAATTFHFETEWPEAVVVYPQGLPIATKVDPAGKEPGWDSDEDAATKPNNRDLAFVDALLVDVHRQFSIDDDRVCAAGFSNGAFFSLLLWATRGERFAAIGAVAGIIRDWKPTVPRPVIYIGGTKDPLVTPELQHDTIEKTRDFDAATGKGEACGVGCTFYASTSRTPVRVLTHPGGHLVPPFATGAIVAFFKNHPAATK